MADQATPPSWYNCKFRGFANYDDTHDCALHGYCQLTRLTTQQPGRVCAECPDAVEAIGCRWRPDGDKMRCAVCGRIVDPRRYDPREDVACADWHSTVPERPQSYFLPSGRKPAAMVGPAPRNIAVITSFFNFSESRAVRENYARFAHELEWWGLPLFTAEIAYGDQQFITTAGSKALRYRAREANLMWQKEALLNRLVEYLPAKYDAVAWIDADIVFIDRDWPTKLLQQLEHFPVVQLWNRWHFTDADGRINQVGQGVGIYGQRYRRNKGHPGGAWAARRAVFPLDPYNVTGGGDSMAVEAWLRMRETFLQRNMQPAWLANYLSWAETAWKKVGGHIGQLQGECLHLYHGARANRKYAERSTWLYNHGYDPTRHVRYDDAGLLAWTDQAPPALVSQIREYLLGGRKEDEGLL